MCSVDHEEILRQITNKITRDDGTCFYEDKRERLDYIKKVLEKSNYEIYGEGSLFIAYKKKEVALSETVVLISSHIDCVREINPPQFAVENDKYYKGTFDNAATNAAVVIAMLENRFADDVIIAFTGDEEVDSKGAKQVARYLKKEGKQIIAIPLDVTSNLKSEEDAEITTFGYASYTIDNLCKNTSRKIAETLFASANEMGIPYMVTRAEEDDEDGIIDYFSQNQVKKKKKEYYKPEYEVEEPADVDEAVEAYFECDNCIGTFSLCLPTTAEDVDDMHSSDPITIKRKAFEEYMDAVVKISGRMCSIIKK